MTEDRKKELREMCKSPHVGWQLSILDCLDEIDRSDARIERDRHRVSELAAAKEENINLLRARSAQAKIIERLENKERVYTESANMWKREFRNEQAKLTKARDFITGLRLQSCGCSRKAAPLLKDLS